MTPIKYERLYYREATITENPPAELARAAERQRPHILAGRVCVLYASDPNFGHLTPTCRSNPGYRVTIYGPEVQP